MHVAHVSSPVLSQEALVADIKRLKRERNAVLLAHYYQAPDIQELADFVGDSLALAQAADRSSRPENRDAVVRVMKNPLPRTVPQICPLGRRPLNVSHRAIRAELT